MIRTLIIAILLIPATPIFLPFIGLAVLVGIWYKPFQYHVVRIICLICTRIFFFVSGAKLVVKGTENLLKNEAALFVGNHKSYIDIPLLIQYSGVPIIFIGKKSLKKAPLLNVMMMAMGSLFLDRDNVREAYKTITEGIKRLESGYTVAIFPEGTRNHSDELLPFKQGSLKLAEKANVPIIPVAIKGTDELFGNNGLKIVPSKVWLTFGEPIDLNTFSAQDKKKSAEYVQSVIQQMYDNMN